MGSWVFFALDWIQLATNDNLGKSLNATDIYLSLYLYYMVSSLSGQDETKSRAVIGYPRGQDEQPAVSRVEFPRN